MGRVPGHPRRRHRPPCASFPFCCALLHRLRQTCLHGIPKQYTATIFPTLAPLPVARTASALAFFSFARTFAQTWGVTIGSTVLQNRLARTLPAEFAAQFPSGAQIAYAAIPVIGGLKEPLQTEVRKAFAESLKTVWLVMVGMSGAGLLSVALMREVPMQQVTDETYGLEDRSQGAVQDSEKADDTTAQRGATDAVTST